ncbi:MAG TPA: flagellar hook capping FlgD N-terminal domain-containing protein [Fimbriimonadaceae bacterium]|nr:flagellar hook capping FlgD N-terminal domain-containing protein [Fimbriimonadaceae bacterium]
MTVEPMDSRQYFGLTEAKSKSKMDMEQFLRLLTVQLENQNPLEPMSDRDFFAQMAQLGTVDGLDKMKKSMDVAQAASLMGKHVSAVRPMSSAGSGGVNSIVSGTVERLSIRNGIYYLGIQEADGGMVDVEMGSIRLISN